MHTPKIIIFFMVLLEDADPVTVTILEFSLFRSALLTFWSSDLYFLDQLWSQGQTLTF
jgi:hypothetical protein